ncbi:MAG: AIPR family protein [Anaerolineae bacterium]|nr:AIPR family protein [Gloeobacterales cyanobacterium ES-bin-313]
MSLYRLFSISAKVDHQKFGGYRANIVTYTLSYLSFIAKERIDLNWIWKHQSLPPDLQQMILITSQGVHQVITNPPDGCNVTEWC